MELLTAEQVERVYRVTDGLRLHRDWVVVPLNGLEEGKEIVLPDGKILLRPPAGERFEAWVQGLPERLAALDLSRAARSHENDPKAFLTGTQGPKLKGTRRYL